VGGWVGESHVFYFSFIKCSKEKNRTGDESNDDDEEYVDSNDGSDDDIDSRAHFVNTRSEGGKHGTYAHSETREEPAPVSTLPKVGVRKRTKRKGFLSKLLTFLKTLYLCILAPIRLLMLLFMRSDPDNIFKGRSNRLGLEKNLAMSTPIDLQRVKNVGKKMKASVNDVILACAGLAMRNYILSKRTDEFVKLPSYVRCIVPISMRPFHNKVVSLDNQVSAVFLKIPLREKDPKKMLLNVKRQMDWLKSLPDAFIMYYLINIFINVLPFSILQRLQNWFYSKSSIILSNVPGRQDLKR